MTTTGEMPLPLAGCKVLDLTAIVLGPLATLCLADLGADVIKVEPPEGDGVRNGGAARHPGMGSIYLALNRNKRSLAIDLKRPEAKDILHRLAAWADVVIHNMRPEAAVRLGIDGDTLRKINPGIIHCSASGFAKETDRAADPAVDDVIQAASGLASLFAGDGQEPRFVPSLIADKVSALLASQAILAALLAREKSGRGQSITLPMAEAISAFVLVEHLGGAAFDPPIGPAGYQRLMTPFRRPMRTRDGYLAITPYSKRHWQSFFAAAGRPDMTNDPRVTDPARRNREIADLYAIVADILPQRSNDEWMRLAGETGIPAAPVKTLDDLVTSRSLRDTGYVVEMEHPSEGRTLGIGPLVRVEGMKPENLAPAPRLGEHTSAVLLQLGFDSATIATWLDHGVVVQSAMSSE